jgi:ubiquinone/menaquinone biosynthesis C-methylase UbiE
MGGTAGFSDSWASGEGYESFVGRLSRLVAPLFIDWLAVAPGARWLDIGSGTGALTEAVLARCGPERVVGVEPSEAFRQYAQIHVPDPRVSFFAGDAQALPVEDGEFDAVVAALVLNFVPDQPGAMAEMRRAARPGGTVAAYVWDYAGGMPMLTTVWDAAVALDPSVAPLHEATRFASNQPDPLRVLFVEAGLGDVAVEGIVVPVVFGGFDAYWAPFLAGTGPAPAYVATLDDERRAALRDAVRARLPIADDGSISLTARAWAVRGTV